MIGHPDKERALIDPVNMGGIRVCFGTVGLDDQGKPGQDQKKQTD